MAITFLRIDDRVIHGQITTRWIRECPCDGIVAVNDSIAEDPILKKIYINACDKKVFIWTIAEWLEKRERVIESKKNYFLITKTAMDMKRILVDESFDPKRREICFGPSTLRPDTKPLAGTKFWLSQEEIDSLEELHKKGYRILFAMVRESAVGYWSDYRERFGCSNQ